ncbi:MAG: tetratricopeptide repeat protein, partial [Candidatus Eisenbacteria bacterium]|nr:tetratricopeptide repeat protein [Candidatus Eisenbacteria bacterium]
MRYGFLPGAVVVLLSLGLLLAGCSDDEENGGITDSTLTAEELSDLGWDAFRDGNYPDALDYFDRALEKDAGLQDARFGLGWTLVRSGSYTEAIAAFDAVLAAGGDAADAHAGR